MKDYSIIELSDNYLTQGFSGHFGAGIEFSVNKGNYSEKDIRMVIDHIMDYFTQTQTSISDGATFGCGSWLLKFVLNGSYIELHELKEVMNGNNLYAFDLSQTIQFLKGQLLLCSQYKETPNIPKLGQKIAVSKEIYQGSEINGVRYPSPDHMTGWYLTSNSYNGDINTLQVDHLYHLIKARPEITKFLALPNGYRFFMDSLGEDVWYDKEAI